MVQALSIFRCILFILKDKQLLSWPWQITRWQPTAGGSQPWNIVMADGWSAMGEVTEHPAIYAPKTASHSAY